MSDKNDMPDTIFGLPVIEGDTNTRSAILAVYSWDRSRVEFSRSALEDTQPMKPEPPAPSPAEHAPSGSITRPEPSIGWARYAQDFHFNWRHYAFFWIMLFFALLIAGFVLQIRMR